jgi:hypothetical protein
MSTAHTMTDLPLTRTDWHANRAEGKSIGIMVAMVIVSILLGLVLGGAYMVLMRTHWIGRMLIFPLGFLVFLGCSYFSIAMASALADSDVQLHLEPLLMCIVGGFVCVNYSKYHHRFHDALQVPVLLEMGAGQCS